MQLDLDPTAPGLSGLSVYVPTLRVPLQDWCAWTGNPWGKVRKIVGHGFRVPAPHENVYTMAANAVLRLIQQYDVDPTRVGFLGLGTESSTDNAAGAVIVRGMVDRALEELGKPRLARNLEVPEFKHACLGGIYALKSALRFVQCDGDDRVAIVVSADVAEYERGSTGEQTQGAGAVAMLVERTPTLLSIDLRKGGGASAYRGPDFRKPVARHFNPAYAPHTQRLSDFPVFSGRYSTYAYLDETAHAVDAMLGKLGAGLDAFDALFFHRPYHHMPVKTLAFLAVRTLARTDPDALAPWCQAAGVQVDHVVAESASAPDLYEGVLQGRASQDPYPATGAVTSTYRKSPAFLALLEQRMGLGTERAMELGNLYSAALPAWLAAGLEHAVRDDVDLTGHTVALVGYGSGDAAEALPATVLPGWRHAAERIGFDRALDGAIDLSQPQYEALHDGTAVPDLDLAPDHEFGIVRVGETYDPGFQDLCVEYYGYLRAG
jgi:hydroxymethylglutaryl-CoA synthase